MGDRDIDGRGIYVLTLKSTHTINLTTLQLMYLIHLVASNKESLSTIKSLHLV